jgi:endoglucanase
MTLSTSLRAWLLAIVLATFCSYGICADQDWQQFKNTFIQSGRVVDISQNGISHTEGQGMAMLLAVKNNDPQTFELVWNWTQRNLQIREDKLLAWSWSPTQGVMDINNASDGDLFIAWALSQAYTRWQEPRYLFAALQISQSIREKLIRKTNFGTVILPGAFGFEKPEGLKLNLSYWVFPAITELATLDPAPEWNELQLTGMRLLEQAQYGKWKLPPDWLMYKDGISTPTDGDRFGYDAVRIPLYLIWGNQASNSNVKPFQSFWSSFKGQEFLPAWVDLKTGDIGTYNASLGFHSIAALTLSYPQIDLAQLPNFDPTEGYYSSMLYLFTKSAVEDLKK